MNMQASVERDVILVRISGIEGELAELKKLATEPFETFAHGVGYKLAQYHLHRALEGVFHITAHILARVPGGQATQYKELAQKLGELGVVPKEFAEGKLVTMAKYRNRLVHFYAQITPEELYGILHKDLGDFTVFLTGVKNLLAHPETFGLTVE